MLKHENKQCRGPQEFRVQKHQKESQESIEPHMSRSVCDCVFSSPRKFDLKWQNILTSISQEHCMSYWFQ